MRDIILRFEAGLAAHRPDSNRRTIAPERTRRVDLYK
jgi:hypothetical protein